MTTVELLGIPVTAQRYADAVDAFLVAAKEQRPFRAHFATVHSIVEATGNEALQTVFESADMVAADGMPLVWLSRRRGAPTAERVCGPDVMLSLCDRGRDVGLRHYFVGGRPGTPEALAERLFARFPGLAVAGTASPPFRSLDAAEDRALVDAINAATPDVIWIGLGSPKQEFWAADHAGRLTAPLILPVGAAFDFPSGRLRRAPRWMQRVGLEWLFRLAAEPRRLFRRYIVTNIRFGYLVAREELSRRRTSARW
jgi:N-acetylglucosaminyldiphosphoundecaprenol N-acetyl-beta-D-mannosaminyltransferase